MKLKPIIISIFLIFTLIFIYLHNFTEVDTNLNYFSNNISKYQARVVFDISINDFVNFEEKYYYSFFF